MTQIQKNVFHDKTLWFFVVVIALGSILKVVVPKTEVYRKWMLKKQVLSEIEVNGELKNSELNLYVTNNSKVKIKDLGIICDYYSDSDSRLGTDELTLYNYFEAGGLIENFGFKEAVIPTQTTKVKCIPVDIELALEKKGEVKSNTLSKEKQEEMEKLYQEFLSEEEEQDN